MFPLHVWKAGVPTKPNETMASPTILTLHLDLDGVKAEVEEAKAICDTLRPYLRQLIKEEVQAAMDETRFALHAAKPRSQEGV